VGDISFTPTFKDVVEYVDDQDRVRVDGPKGFNTRFDAIQSDLAQLSTVVAAIGTELDQLEATPPPTTHRLTLPLRLLPDSGFSPWVTGPNGEAEAQLDTDAHGVMNVTLPDGAVLLSMRVVGESVGPTIKITLIRAEFNAPFSVNTLATFTARANPYDLTQQIDEGLGVVDTGRFAYFIQASCGKTAPDTVTADISALQVTFRA
jgi:hypothetical protein